MPSSNEILESVREVLVDALGVEDDEVTPEATLTGDLGAESIDFLDIVFRLEKTFDIKIPRAELFPEQVLTDPECVVDGRFTPKGLEELTTRMPFVDLTDFSKNPTTQDFGSLFTVSMICSYLESKLGVEVA